jgi:hypothetical protein
MDEEFRLPVTSKDIIEDFINAGKPLMFVNMDEMGDRSAKSVYNSLLTYVNKHSDLGISVRWHKGDIVLVDRIAETASKVR